MARKPRIHVPGGFYHVILRGNGGQDIFNDDSDRHYMIDLLAEGTERFGFRVHGYCLMPNHMHLVLQAGAQPLSRPIHNLSFRHTRRVNTRGNRTGHLFQGRYKAILVDAESYLLELVRYVHLNPVRAGLAREPESWRWCGHQAYLGLVTAPWLTMDRVLELFAPGLELARAAYLDFVNDGIGGKRRAMFHDGNGAAGRVLGDDGFIEAALKQTGETPVRPPEVADILELVAREYGVELPELAGASRGRFISEARGMAGLLARETGAAGLSDLAARFGREQSSFSRVVRHVENRMAREPDVAERLRRLKAFF